MLRGLDHLVILVDDLDAAAQGFREIGFAVQTGGRHGSGTHNRLVTFEDGCYLEIIAFHAAAPEHRWWMLRSPGGFIDYCVVTDDLSGDRQTFEDAGVSMTLPYPLTRTRPDGVELHWFVSVPKERGSCLTPFLIRDVTPRRARIGEVLSHPNGATRIRRIQIAVESLDLVARWLALFNLPHRSNRSHEAGIETLSVQMGVHEIEYLCRTRSGPAELATAQNPRFGPIGMQIDSCKSTGRVVFTEALSAGAAITLLGES